MKKNFFKIVFLISIVFIILGFLKKQNIDIRNKAWVACLECIGIG